MGISGVAAHLARIVDASSDAGDLAAAMAAITAELGFQYFALTHHVDIVAADGGAVRLHNYPQPWVDYHDKQRLGPSDPVHRASHTTTIGFWWSSIPEMIALTAQDQLVLAHACEQGIGNGFTVPAHFPGEASGSCSFATPTGHQMLRHMRHDAQVAGGFAFEAARRLWSARGTPPAPQNAMLTDRQRDCLLWAARGKADYETGIILGISPRTVTAHIKQACDRYGVTKRSALVIRALFDGTLTFSSIFFGR